MKGCGILKWEIGDEFDAEVCSPIGEEAPFVTQNLVGHVRNREKPR